MHKVTVKGSKEERTLTEHLENDTLWEGWEVIVRHESEDIIDFTLRRKQCQRNT